MNLSDAGKRANLEYYRRQAVMQRLRAAGNEWLAGIVAKQLDNSATSPSEVRTAETQEDK